MNKKVRIILLSVIAFLIITLTTTYAYWYVVRHQTNSNIVKTACLDISLTNEQNDINLTNQFPMSDEEGMKLTPYTFTVTNNCNRSIDYQVNLEALNDGEDKINSSSIKVSLNDSITLLSNKETRETTLENAYVSYQLMYGRLEENESDDHSLRLWVDENAPISESNKVFESKIVVIAGQGIENPFNEGTLTFNIIANVGGTGNITELNSNWIEGEFGTEEAVSVSDYQSYYWGTDYKFDSVNGYTLTENLVEATLSECRETDDLCGEFMLFKTGSKKDISEPLYRVTSLVNETGDYYITAQKKNLYNDFSSITTEDYAQLHQAEDDFGTSYYYRGNVQNNYVKFGKWSDNATEIRGYVSKYSDYESLTYSSLEECNNSDKYNNNCTEIAKAEAGKDMYWRIIRINGDGTIRMIYDGTEAVANGIIHSASIGNTAYDITEEVGFSFLTDDNTQKSSTMKSYLDFWYNQNIKGDYGAYVADNIFCNDKEVHNIENTQYDQILRYGAHKRLYLNKTPKLTCAQDTDKYTINTKYGNGYLTNPVGLITADEVAMAGGVSYKLNETFYLASSDNSYWTMSPYYSGSSSTNKYGFVWNTSTRGEMVVTNSADWVFYAVRPVINLKADLQFIGEGTIDNPYEIVMN